MKQTPMSGSLCYLATPYSKFKPDIHAAFEAAAKLSGQLRLAGIDVYSPVVQMHPQALHAGIDPMDLDIWLPANLTMMRLSDVLIVAEMEGWHASTGINYEIDWFGKAGKPIFHIDPDTLTMRKIQPASAPHRRIYVASSWRNSHHPAVVAALRLRGHEVYDFRNPVEGNQGFSWREMDPDWMGWSPAAYARLIHHPVAHAGFKLDKEALDWCDTCVLVLPCGRSAHLEAGYACGQRKRVIFYLQPEKFEPELMYLLGSALAVDLNGLCEMVRVSEPGMMQMPALNIQTAREFDLAHDKTPSMQGGSSV